jgi:hypothetical protein
MSNSLVSDRNIQRYLEAVGSWLLGEVAASRKLRHHLQIVVARSKSWCDDGEQGGVFEGGIS